MMVIVSKSAKHELERLRKSGERTKNPIEYVNSYEYRGFKLGEELRVQSEKSVIDVKIIGFQKDTDSKKFIGVKFLGETPKAFKDIYYGKLKDNRLIDIGLKGEEESPMLWCSTEYIVK